MTDRDRIQVIAAAELIGEERRRHEGFMERAVRQARRNPERPFGAVLVERASGRTLGRSGKRRPRSPILHGETHAIDACARSHPRVSWPEVTLYTTAEPCPMCAAAIAWTGIGEVVIGTDMETINRLGISQIHIAADGAASRPVLPRSLDFGHSCQPNPCDLRRLGGPASARSQMRTLRKE